MFKFVFCSGLLESMTAQFDEKMRLLLDPNYSSAASSGHGPVSPTGRVTRSKSGVSPNPSPKGQRGQPAGAASRRASTGFGAEKEHHHSPPEQQGRPSKSQLRRGRLVDRRSCGGAKPNVVIRNSNSSLLKRSDSLTKREKQTANLVLQDKKNKSPLADLDLNLDLDALAAANSGTTAAKLLKTLANNRRRRSRIRRRHTVGGTKDLDKKDFAVRKEDKEKSVENEDDDEDEDEHIADRSLETAWVVAVAAAATVVEEENEKEVDLRRLSLPDSAMVSSSSLRSEEEPMPMQQQQQQQQRQSSSSSKMRMPSLLESQV